MNVRIDFVLNNRFGKLEHIIFKLVLNGFSDSREIAAAFPIFSDYVIAKAIKNLVNQQMITVDLKSGKLSISEPIRALISACLNKRFEIQIPDSLLNIFDKRSIVISSNQGKESNILKRELLTCLLPNVKLDHYITSLDFVLTPEEGDSNYGK